MQKYNPYEYINGKPGIQGRAIFSGKNAHPESLCLIGERGLQMKVERGQVIKLRINAPNSPMLVQLDTLPQKWQEAVAVMWGNPPRLVQQSLFEKHFVRDMAAFDFYSWTFRFDDGTGLDKDKIDEYTLNASVLNTAGRIYDMRYKLRKELRGEVRDIWGIITTEINRFKTESGHTLPENEQYLRRVYNKYKTGSYKAIISGKHKNINARKVFDHTEQLLNNLFAGVEQKPTAAEVAGQYDGFLSGYVEVINNETGELYNPKEYKQISESTIRTYLTKWENEIGTHKKRSGDRQKYMQRFKPYHSLNQPGFAGSIISIDDRQPVFKYAENKRMWFYNGIDLGSEAFTCWVYGKEKAGIISEFYRQMVRNYAQWGLNLPAELEGELNLNASFKDTFLKEGNMFQYVRIEANNARGKRIEAYYRPLRYKYEKRRAGWLARPFALSEANQAGPGAEKIIPYDEIVEGCLRDIQTWNNSEHSKIKGMSRWDVFLSMQNPKVRPTNYHGILPYLGYKTETSVHAGIIRFRNSEFLLGMDGVIAVGNKLINLMKQAENRDIDIYWLNNNFGGVLKAHIYIGNQFICEAVEKPRYNKARIEQTDEDLINRELMSKYVATTEAYGKNRAKQIDNVTIVDNRPVTVGNSFVMPGLHNPVISDETARTLEDINDNEEMFMGEAQTQSFVPSMKERF
ncbi:hypothetical protein [Dysgonomonas termitidis]|uniref:Uncharacterized protein n=1 Tax=Dysgonomonas termitidis TaxID=1516126 RepID=A0ABV9KU78_9BACT